MKTTWQKFTLWTRLITVGLAALYLLLFIWKNSATKIKINFIFGESNDITALILLFFTSVISIIGWWLLMTIFRTMRQMREIQRRTHLEKIEKEHKDMLEKAARLQSRESHQDGNSAEPANTR